MYDTIKIERDSLQAAIHIHNKLMEKFLNGSGAQSFVDETYRATHIPVILEDDQFNLVATARISSQETLFYNKSFKEWINQSGNMR